MFVSGKADKADLLRLFTVIHRYNVAGLSVIESVKSYAKNTDKESVKEITDSIITQLENGISFPEAMEKHPDFFPSYVIELIRVGENTGEMAAILDEINLFLQQDIDMERDINSSMWVQKVFIIGILFILAVALFVVIPQMGEVLKGASLQLPLITRAILWIGDIAASFWWLFAGFASGVYLYLKKMKKENPVRYAWLKFNIPIFKSVYYYQLQYRFTKIFGLCKEANVDTMSSLKYTAMASDNAILQHILKKALIDMEKTGMDFVQAIQKSDNYKIIDQSMYTMLRAGGATSNIGQIMLAEADGYRKELSAVLKLLGDKIGLSITIPGYICLIILFAALELPLLTLMDSVGKVGG